MALTSNDETPGNSSAGSPPDEAEGAAIVARRKPRLRERAWTYFFGDDVFISYARRDGSRYAQALARALVEKGISFYLDQWSVTTPGAQLPPTLRTALGRSMMLVVVATEAAKRSQAVEDEIKLFLGTQRKVSPIAFDDDTLSDAIWFSHVEGLPIKRESRSALGSNEPSIEIIDDIDQSTALNRRSRRLRRSFGLTLLATLLVAFVAAAVVGGASKQARDATRAAQEAGRQAEKQAGIAQSRSLANRSQTLLRQRPEELPAALSLAVNAMKRSLTTGVRTVEADSALRDNLALLPRLRSSHKYAGHGETPNGIALSPDGQHFAILPSDKPLRIYEAADQAPFDKRKPVREFDCGCSAVALSNGLSYAAGVVEGGVKLFDLKDDGKSQLIKLEGAVSVSQMALSPRGRYLALSYDDGEDVGRFSRMLVIETRSGRTIKALNDLNILINDIGFGSTGVLAIGGKFGGQGFGRVVFWELPLKPSDDGGEPNLKQTSFDNPQIVSQQREVSAVAPGYNSTFFAADGAVWKRTSGAMDYSVVARLPYVRDFPSWANVSKLAFGPGGRTLTLARTIDARDQNNNESDQSVLEIWDLPGHRDLANVFHPKEVTNVGFKPSEPLVVTLTDPSLIYEPPRVFRAVNGERMGRVTFEPESAAAKESPLVSSSGRHVVSIYDSAVIVWDLWGKRKVSVPFGDFLKQVKLATVGPDGKFLVMAGYSTGDKRYLAIYRADGDSYREWKRIPQPDDDLEQPGAMSISADGKRLAVLYSYAERFVRIWRVEDGSDVTPDDLHNAGDVSQMLLGPNGHFLVLSDTDNQTQLLDLSGGPSAKRKSLLDNTSISSIAFSADDRYLAVGADNGTAYVFDTSMPDDQIANLIHTGKVTAMSFSDDGKYLATASSYPHPYRIDEDESYPVRIWLLRPADLIAEAQSRLAPFELGTPGQ